MSNPWDRPRHNGLRCPVCWAWSAALLAILVLLLFVMAVVP